MRNCEINRAGQATVGRRGFLATVAAAGMGGWCVRGTMAGPIVQASPPAAGGSSRSAIPRRILGKTGLELPILAMGGSAMVAKWQAAYGPQLPFQGRVAMVRRAFEAGVRYFDTSPNYGESEAILGEALHDVRGEIYLATKVGVPRSDDAILTRDQVRASVETSLRTLKVDSVDCIQVHGPAFEYNGQRRAEELQEELVKLRDEKLCRFIGLTGHNRFETMFRLIDSGRFDQLLIAFGYFPKGMDTILSHANLQWRERCLSRAHELGMGVVAMKVMSSFILGHGAGAIAPGFSQERLIRLRAAALRWALADRRITLAVVGCTRPDDIDQNVRTVTGDLRLGDDDLSLLGEFATLAFASPSIRALKVQ
jgi:aryl-alcohol dehydrogenase-like predicted oxidoreductase